MPSFSRPCQSPRSAAKRSLHILLCNIVNKFETLTHEHHFAIEAAVAFKVSVVIASPPFQVVILSFGKRKVFVNITKTRLRHFQSLNDQSRRPVPVDRIGTRPV